MHAPRQPSRSFLAARYAIDNNVSYTEAAAKFGVRQPIVSECAVILRFGTPEEIAAVERGEVSIHVARTIRARIPKEERGRRMEVDRNRPEDEEVRKAAFEGARLAMSQKIALSDIAKQTGASPQLISWTITVLTHGTPEEIAAAESFKVSLWKIYQTIRARVPAEERTKQQVLSEEQQLILAGDKDVWGRVADAFTAISALPRPADVVTICRKNRQRSERISRELATVYSWIEEFANAWTK